MFLKENIPGLYHTLVKKNYVNYLSSQYIWLDEWEWMHPKDVMNYQYEKWESKEILPFAFTGRGDKYVFVDNNSKEPYIGFCRSEEAIGSYYAKDLEEAMVKNILEFVSDNIFYIDKNIAESWEMGIDELRFYLKKYTDAFDGIIKHKYIELINDLKTKELRKFHDDYCEWHALLSDDEASEMIKSYLDGELDGKTFTWRTIEFDE